MSTATRILLGFVLVLSVAFYFLLEKLTDRVERQYLEAAEESMVDVAHIFASILEVELEKPDPVFDELRRAFDGASRRSFEALIYNQTKRYVDMNLYVTDAEGIVLFDSQGGEAEGKDYSRFRDVSITLAGGYGARSTRTNEQDSLSSVMHVGAPIRKADQIIGMVSISKPQASMWAFINETKSRILLYGWMIFLAIMVAAVAVSRWGSTPIRKLTEYARAVRRGERVALPEFASPEARTLGRALDEMRDSLEDRKYVESYVQTLTHEMKSPVAAIRGAADLLSEEDMPADQRGRFLGNISTETERLQNIIDRLLSLSAIESRKNLESPVTIVLTDLVETICANHEHAFESRRVSLKRKFDCRPEMQGEEFLLEIAVGNLLQNALEFSPEGGTVTVSVAKRGDMIEVTVEDEGPGVPDYARERVFDRFYSLQHPDTGKKSSGLGLCFVKEAAELHSGSATLENRVEQGARATLSLRA